MGGVRGRGGRGRGKWGDGWLGSSQCCQVAEIPAIKLKSGGEKKVEKLAGRICGQILAELFPELAKLFFMYSIVLKIILGPVFWV
jgi:hypothetical protein